MFYVKWLFENCQVAKEVIRKAIAENDVATSFGVGDEQYAGFDFAEGTISYTPYQVGNKELCCVEWQAEAQSTDEDYWLSPHCFEDVDTFDLNGNSIRGEEFDFGLK